MRILLAYDGSPGSEQALALANALDWPAGVSIRVVLVVEPVYAALGPLGMAGSTVPSLALDEEVMAIQRGNADEAVRRLARDGRTVEGAAIIGRPGSVLVDEATRFGADLVLVGSRGHGPILSLVLGSVSAEVIDYAPCPVLVARRAGVSKVLLATDGSEPSAAAQEVVRTWPIFDGTSIRVVSVAEVEAPWHAGIAPTMHAQVVAAFANDVELARAKHARLAQDAADSLRASGRSAEASFRKGDAAGEIIAAAEEWGADLIVVGSRGETGLPRLLLGSVARNVLHGSRASVLVVHGAAHGQTKA
jgi:nucleotide-binding universal stress UspA family protein